MNTGATGGRRRRAVLGAVVCFAAGLGGAACSERILLGTQDGGDSSEVLDSREAVEGAADASPIERIPDIGAPGWRDSTEPWVRPPESVCDPGAWNEGLGRFDLWADDTGVYVLFGWTTRDPTGTEVTGLLRDDISISVNRGTAWEPFFAGRNPCDDAPRYRGGNPSLLAGVVGGELVAVGGGSIDYGWYPSLREDRPPEPWDGPLLRIGGGGASAWLPCETVLHEVWLVHDNLGYATGSGSAVHMRFDGTAWADLDVPELPVYLTWADEDDVFLAGADGTVISRSSLGWVVHDIDTSDHFTSLWGFDGDDVWAGTLTGALWHYDGVSWIEVPWPNPRDPDNPCEEHPHAPVGMWGAGGELFFHTGDAVVHWDGEFEVLAHWPRSVRSDCLHDGVWVWRIRGLSPTEVFVAGEGEADPDNGCKQPFVLFWDGAEFHWM